MPFYPSCTAHLFQPVAEVKEGVAGVCVRCNYPQVLTVHQHVQMSVCVHHHPDTTARSDVTQCQGYIGINDQEEEEEKHIGINDQEEEEERWFVERLLLLKVRLKLTVTINKRTNKRWGDRVTGGKNVYNAC